MCNKPSLKLLTPFLQKQKKILIAYEKMDDKGDFQ